MRKWLFPVAIALVAFAIGGCGEPPVERRVMTPTESDLQEMMHEIEAVENDAARLKSDIERARKILMEMEQSLDRIDNSTRDVKRATARLLGRPIEDDPSERSGLGTTISWIIALTLLLIVALLFVFKYLETRKESQTWTDPSEHPSPPASEGESDPIASPFSPVASPPSPDAASDVAPSTEDLDDADASDRDAPQTSGESSAPAEASEDQRREANADGEGEKA